MHRPAILLDENLIWCCDGPDRQTGELLKDALAALGFTRDSIFYVGQTDTPADATKEISPMIFHRELEEYARWFVDAAQYCEGTTKRTRHPTQAFKRCFADQMEGVYGRKAPATIRAEGERYDAAGRVGIGNRTMFRVPPLGSNDPDIRAWATANGILIVSADRGAELEPVEASTRVAVRSQSCPCADEAVKKAYAKSMAAAVHARLLEIKMLLREVREP